MSSVYLFDSYIALYHIVIYLFVCFFLIVVFFLFFFFFIIIFFFLFFFFFFQAEDGIRDRDVTGVQTCALPISFVFPQSFHGQETANLLMIVKRLREDKRRPYARLCAGERAVFDEPVEILRSEERRVGKECRSRW